MPWRAVPVPRRKRPSQSVATSVPSFHLGLELFCDHGIGQRPDALDRGTHHVSCLEKYAPRHADPGRRAGRDHIPGLKRYDRGEIGDLLAHGPDHVGRAVLLHDLLVDLELHRQRLWIWNGMGRHDPWPERGEGVVALALKPVELERVVPAHVEVAEMSLTIA